MCTFYYRRRNRARINCWRWFGSASGFLMRLITDVVKGSARPIRGAGRKSRVRLYRCCADVHFVSVWAISALYESQANQTPVPRNNSAAAATRALASTAALSLAMPPASISHLPQRFLAHPDAVPFGQVFRCQCWPEIPVFLPVQPDRRTRQGQPAVLFRSSLNRASTPAPLLRCTLDSH